MNTQKIAYIISGCLVNALICVSVFVCMERGYIPQDAWIAAYGVAGFFAVVFSGMYFSWVHKTFAQPDIANLESESVELTTESPNTNSNSSESHLVVPPVRSRFIDGEVKEALVVPEPDMEKRIRYQRQLCEESSYKKLNENILAGVIVVALPDKGLLCEKSKKPAVKLALTKNTTLLDYAQKEKTAGKLQSFTNPDVPVITVGVESPDA